MTRPPRIETRREARTWLAWAREAHHQGSCACRGCLRSREVLRNEAPTTPEPRLPEPTAEGTTKP
jgi:hypothetical protein